MNQIVCLRHRHRPYQWRQHRPEIPHQHPHRIRQLLINSSRHRVKIPSSFTHASEKSKQVESHRRQTQPTFVIRTQKTAKRPKSFILTSSLSPTAIRCSSIWESKLNSDTVIFDRLSRSLWNSSKTIWWVNAHICCMAKVAPNPKSSFPRIFQHKCESSSSSRRKSETS